MLNLFLLPGTGKPSAAPSQPGVGRGEGGFGCALGNVFFGHDCPVDQSGRDQPDIAVLRNAGHQAFEAGEAQFFLVKFGITAYQALLD